MSKKNKGNKPKEIVPMKIEQNIPVNPPQSFEPKTMSINHNEVEDVKLEKMVSEIGIPVATTPRGVIILKLKSLAHDIAELQPHSKGWCDMLEEIGDLKRKAGNL